MSNNAKICQIYSNCKKLWTRDTQPHHQRNLIFNTNQALVVIYFPRFTTRIDQGNQLLSRVPEMNPAWLIRYSRVASQMQMGSVAVDGWWRICFLSDLITIWSRVSLKIRYPKMSPFNLLPLKLPFRSIAGHAPVSDTATLEKSHETAGPWSNKAPGGQLWCFFFRSQITIDTVWWCVTLKWDRFNSWPAKDDSWKGSPWSPWVFIWDFICGQWDSNFRETRSQSLWLSSRDQVQKRQFSLPRHVQGVELGIGKAIPKLPWWRVGIVSPFGGFRKWEYLHVPTLNRLF